MEIQSVLCIPVNKLRQALPEGAGQTAAKVGVVVSLALLLVGTIAPFLLPHGSMGFYLSISLGVADFIVFVGLIVYLSHQKIPTLAKPSEEDEAEKIPTLAKPSEEDEAEEAEMTPASAKTAREYEALVKQMPSGFKTIEGYLEKYYKDNRDVNLMDQFKKDAHRKLEFRVDGKGVNLDGYPSEDVVRAVSHQSAAADVTGILMPLYVNTNLNRSLSEAKLCANAIKDGKSVSAVQYFVTFKIKDEADNIMGYIQTRTHIDLSSGNAEIMWSKPFKPFNPFKKCPTTAFFKAKKSR